MRKLLAAIVLVAMVSAPAWALEGRSAGTIATSGTGNPTLNGHYTINNQANDTSYGLDILFNAVHAAPSNSISLESSAASNAWHIQVDSVVNGGGLYLSSDLATGTTLGAMSCYPTSGKPDNCQIQSSAIDVLDVDLLHHTSVQGPASAAVSRGFILPAVAPTIGQSLIATAAGGNTAWTSTSDHFGASGLLGGLASTAAATLLQSCIVAPRAGHFTTLDCTTDFLTACTTAPAFNVRDNTATTTGIAKSCGTAAGAVTQAETLVFAAGDTICITRTTNGGTCTVPFFAVNATVTYP